MEAERAHWCERCCSSRRSPVGALRSTAFRLAQLDRRVVAQRVAVVSQRESLVFPLPVWEYVALGRHPHEGPWAAAPARSDVAIAGALDRAGIAFTR